MMDSLPFVSRNVLNCAHSISVFSSHFNQRHFNLHSRHSRHFNLLLHNKSNSCRAEYGICHDQIVWQSETTATNARVPFGILDYNIIIRICALRNCPLIYSGVDFFGGAFSMCAIKLTPKLNTQN